MKKLLAFVVLLFAAVTSAIAGGRVRVGYWTSGVSLGYGAALEETRVLEKEGVEVQYVRFPDLLAQIQALSTGDIDIAYAAPISAVFGAIADGHPVKIVAATQLADAVLVAPPSSSVKGWADLKGRRVGASKPNAATTVIGAAIADSVYGVGRNSYTVISGNEARLAQYLAQGQVDAAIIRTFTYDQFAGKLGLKKIGSLSSDWKRVTGSSATPYIAVGVARADFLRNNPDIVAKVIRSWTTLDRWGASHAADVAAIAQKRAGMTAENAKIYAKHWKSAYRVSLDNATIKNLKAEHDAFARAGLVKGAFTSAIYDQGPYLKATGKK